MSEFYNDGASMEERYNNNGTIDSDSDSTSSTEIYYRSIMRSLTSETKEMSRSLRIIADNTQLNRCLMVIYIMISIFLGYFYCAYNAKYYELDELKNNLKFLDVRINGLRSDFQNQTSNYKEWTVTVLLVALTIFMVRKL